MRRKNADEGRRRAERDAARTGALDDLVRDLVARMRAGVVNDDALQALARIGYAPAQELAGHGRALRAGPNRDKLLTDPVERAFETLGEVAEFADRTPRSPLWPLGAAAMLLSAERSVASQRIRSRRTRLETAIISARETVEDALAIARGDMPQVRGDPPETTGPVDSVWSLMQASAALRRSLRPHGHRSDINEVAYNAVNACGRMSPGTPQIAWSLAGRTGFTVDAQNAVHVARAVTEAVAPAILAGDVMASPLLSGPLPWQTKTNHPRRRNMADDQFRTLERAYLATPADSTLLGQLLRSVARTRGGAPGAIIWIDTLWRNNGLTPDHVDLDVLAEAAFESSSFSEDLRQNLEAVERIALAADASDLEDVHEDDRDQDQRAPWWRRERFHDIDFDRSHPHKGGRLYSPARGSIVKVSEVTLDRGAGKRPVHRGWLLVERPIERLVYGVDAVLVDMAQGPITKMSPISTWLLRRVLSAAANAATSLVKPFHHAVFVTDMRDDPTDVVEQIAGAPAAPLGGASRTYIGRGPMTGLWEGALGRQGRVEVMRASGTGVSRLLDTALYHWLVAKHPYRVRLDELRTNYHEERGGESLSLIWVGRGKRPDATDGVEIMAWSNENTDPVTEEFEWGEPIADQLELDETNDWTSAAARAAHDAEAIVVEDWMTPPEREGPYELGNLLVAGVTCNERFSIRNDGAITVGGDRGDVRALSAVNVGDGVLMHDARLVTTDLGLTDDEAVERAIEIVMASWDSVGEDTFNQTRRR